MIEALELGNEPNLYGSFTWYVPPDGVHVMGRPPGYDFSSFLDDFTSFAKGLPGPLAGPADGRPDGWRTPPRSSPPSRASRS